MQWKVVVYWNDSTFSFLQAEMWKNGMYTVFAVSSVANVSKMGTVEHPKNVQFFYTLKTFKKPSSYFFENRLHFLRNVDNNTKS